VRDALLASVTCTLPLVSFHTSHESTVPKASRPAFAIAFAPVTFWRIHVSLVAEKYASRTRPVLRRITRSSFRARRRSQSAAVRRSCQTIALQIGFPLSRSHTTVVSRWLVMPIAATSDAFAFAFVNASAATPACVDQMSPGSCSTQPGRGKICGNSFCATETMEPA
jgi:hypothetical protein